MRMGDDDEKNGKKGNKNEERNKERNSYQGISKQETNIYENDDDCNEEMMSRRWRCYC